MKAIHITEFVKDITNIKPKNAPDPTPSSVAPIIVHITHAAVTHVDLLYAQGLHQNNKRHVQPPFVLGTEFAGVVESSPPSSSFPPGTRVFGSGLGSYAESICVPEAAVRKVPDGWTNADACAVGASGAVSYGALLSVAQIKAGESVLVLGASGGLGCMAVQIAKAKGASVIAVVGGQEKADVAKRIGADQVVDYKVGKWEDQVLSLTNGTGVDVVYDSIGAIEAGIKCLKYRGRLVIVGFAARHGDIENVRANRILLKSVMVHGYRFGEDGRRDPRRTKEVWDGFMGLLEEGKIEPVVYGTEYRGLESVAKALEDAKDGRAWGRAVVRIDEEAEGKLGDAKPRL